MGFFFRPRAALCLLLLCFCFLASAAARAQVHPPTKLYLHTEGLDVRVSPPAGQGCIPGVHECGVSDARSNTSWLPDLRESVVSIGAMEYDAFGPGKAMVRAALLASVRELLRGIDIQVVDRRPAPHERYSMVVIGGHPRDIGLDGSIAGLAPLDCQDSNPWDITFVFSKTLADLDAVARVTVQEAAHSYGIEHVRAPEFVMNPEPIGGLMGLGRSCLPLDPSPGLSNPDGIKCLHLCEDPGYQNSFAEMQALFGKTPLPRAKNPPKIAIRYPEQANHFFESKLDLRIDVEILNPADLTQVELSVNGSPFLVNPMFPYAFALSDLGPGSYRARVIARDIHGAHSEAQVHFSVGPSLVQGEKHYPELEPEQISRRIHRLNGEPVRCESDKVCYGGTRCIDGMCLRPLSEQGCTLGSGAGEIAPQLGLGILCALLARRQKKQARECSHRLARQSADGPIQSTR